MVRSKILEKFYKKIMNVSKLNPFFNREDIGKVKIEERSNKPGFMVLDSTYKFNCPLEVSNSTDENCPLVKIIIDQEKKKISLVYGGKKFNCTEYKISSSDKALEEMERYLINFQGKSSYQKSSTINAFRSKLFVNNRNRLFYDPLN